MSPMRQPAQLPDMAPLPGTQPGRAHSAGRRRWSIAIAALVVAVLIGGSALWAAVSPGSYGKSQNGCVTASVPSTTGGGLVHACGKRAKTLCQLSFTKHDQISLALRPECRLAGLGN
ncbi:MAG: hypothetical protein ABJB47_04575 [Actinomycetota bacterium]